MKLHLVLAMVVLLAGCIGGEQVPSTGGDDKPPAGDGGQVTGDELAVELTDFPVELSAGEAGYFKITARAAEDVESVKVVIYNLGTFLESACGGTNSFRDIPAGETKEASCSLKVTDEPLEDTEHEVSYEASYKVSEYAGQVGVKVYDADEYMRVKPPAGSDSVSLGPGTLDVSPLNAKEGEDITVRLSIGGDLAEGDSCGCNVESVVLKVPKGFSVSGPSGWVRSSCGSFNCYEKRNALVPVEDEFTLSIAGVTMTDTFYVGAELHGVWKVTRGSEAVTLLSGTD